MKPLTPTITRILYNPSRKTYVICFKGMSNLVRIQIGPRGIRRGADFEYHEFPERYMVVYDRRAHLSPFQGFDE